MRKILIKHPINFVLTFVKIFEEEALLFEEIELIKSKKILSIFDFFHGFGSGQVESEIQVSNPESDVEMVSEISHFLACLSWQDFGNIYAWYQALKLFKSVSK